MVETIIVVLGVLADQLSKIWISNHFYGMSRVIIPGVLSYSYVENTGAAFGMLGDSTVMLAVVTGLLALVLLYVLIRYRHLFSRLSKIALAFMMAGALGNLVDRVFLGYVVDFIKFDFIEFAVFNIADICVNMGTVLLILSIFFLEWGRSVSPKAKQPSCKDIKP